MHNPWWILKILFSQFFENGNCEVSMKEGSPNVISYLTQLWQMSLTMELNWAVSGEKTIWQKVIKEQQKVSLTFTILIIWGKVLDDNL